MAKNFLSNSIFLAILLFLGRELLPSSNSNIVPASSNNNFLFASEEITIYLKEDVGAISIVVVDNVPITGIPSVDS